MRTLGYPLSTDIAEKLCIAIDLDDISTGVRDYADIWILIRRHDLDATDLCSALTATARHRGVQLRPLSDAGGRSGVMPTVDSDASAEDVDAVAGEPVQACGASCHGEQHVDRPAGRFRACAVVPVGVGGA